MMTLRYVHFWHNQKAVTLVELMFVLLIMALLLVLGLPSLHALMIEQRLRAETHQLLVALHFTRSEAIARGRPILLCRADGNQCSHRASAERAATDWGSGWLVIDHNRILWRQAALDKNTQVIGFKKSIQYGAMGNVSSSFTRLVVSHNGKFVRTICVARSGRVRLKKASMQC